MRRRRPYNVFDGPGIGDRARGLLKKLRRRPSTEPQPDPNATEVHEVVRVLPDDTPTAVIPAARDHRPPQDPYRVAGTPGGHDEDDTIVSPGLLAGATVVFDKVVDDEPATGNPVNDDTQVLPRQDGDESGTDGHADDETQVIEKVVDDQSGSDNPANADTQVLPRHRRPELSDPPTWPPLSPGMKKKE